MGKIAFVFSGQGAQYTGMGKELYDCSPAAKAVFDMADSIRPNTSEQCFTAEQAELNRTVNTQPCVFTADLAAAQAVVEKGIKPDFVAGFSLGEIAALGFSGIMSHEDAFKLVCKRGELMDKAAQETKGAMVAVMKLSPEKVEEIASKFENTYPVNYNSQAQIVVATTEENVEPLMEAVKAEKGRAKQLAVSGAFHSPFMHSAAMGLAEYLQDKELSSPIVPVYSNVTAQPYEGDYKELIKQQVESPVQWLKTVENLIDLGVDTFIEVGVGKTLASLIKKINKDVTVYNIENKETLDLLNV
ncbi:MAG: ACP S-malonyltransferase [Acutalibacteraceae bacterium]|nr:ACP S-malonyltransferase [Acutalibacteraceae bacterium]